MSSNNILQKKLLIMYLGIFFLFLYIAYVMVARPDAPYMNTLSYLVDYGKWWFKSPFLLFKSWPQGQQSGLIDPLFTYINIRLFSLNSLLASVSTGFLILYIYILISNNIILTVDHSNRNNVSLWILIIAIATSCFSLNGWQLYDLDLGTPEYFRNLTYLFIVLFFNRNLVSSQKVTAYKHTLFFLMIFISICIFGMGEVYAFAFSLSFSIFFMYLSERYHERGSSSFQVGNLRSTFLITRNRLLTSFIPLLFISIYFFISRIYSSDIFAPTDFTIKMFYLVPMALTTSVISAETIRFFHVSNIYVIIFGSIMIIMYISCLFFLFKQRKHTFYFTPLFMSTYGLLVSLSIVIARGAGGPSFVMVSRYYVNYFFFFIGLIWMLFILERAESSYSKFLSLNLTKFSIGLYFVIISLTLQITSSAIEFSIAPYRAQYFQDMEKIICSKSALSVAESDFLQANNLSTTIIAKHYAKQNSLGPYRLGGTCYLINSNR